MMKKLGKLVKDFKVWLFILGLAVAITTKAIGWWEVPKKVKLIKEEAKKDIVLVRNEIEKVDEKAEEAIDQVQEVAYRIKQYIAVQAEKEEGAERREQLLIDILNKE